jgi:hypothetical protein
MAAARAAFEKVLGGKADSIATHYSKRIFKNDAVLLDARKKLWPDSDEAETTGDTFIQFTFGSVVVAATPQPEPIEIIPDAIEIKQPSPPPRQPGQPPVIQRKPIDLPGLHQGGRPGFNGGALHLGGDEGGGE